MIAFILAALLATGAWQAVQTMKDAARTYMFGYPLVLMDVTGQVMTDPRTGKAPVNHFSHVQVFPDHLFREVVRPNNDTLYSTAWLDLSHEPLVLSVPSMAERYYVMPFMDAWTNVFAMVGTRTTGAGPGNYMVAGPDWKGEIPADVKVIHSPTNMCWLIGRIQTNAESDIPNVNKLQRQFKLTPLARWDSRRANPSVVRTGELSKVMTANPSQMVEKMSAGEFFARLGRLMKEEPPAATDAPVLEILKRFGVEPGRPFRIDNISIVRRLLLEKAVSIARRRLQETAERDRGRREENNWALVRSGIGVYKTDYELRAFVAMIGLGALPVEEAAYANAKKDRDGKPLDGRNRYRVHFAADQTPPVDAFWSLTLYDKEGFLVNNSIHRYTIGDRDSLSRNRDGSIDIFIGQDFPITGSTNWLPSCRGPFEVTMRLYMPKQGFLDGTWKPPGIEKISDGK